MKLKLEVLIKECLHIIIQNFYLIKSILEFFFVYYIIISLLFSYKLNVKLVSNYDKVSDPIFVKTSEEAPEIPTNNDIENKIIPLTTDIESKSEQYVIEIDLSLFSNQYGIVHFYKIYVRQGK